LLKAASEKREERYKALWLKARALKLFYFLNLHCPYPLNGADDNIRRRYSVPCYPFQTGKRKKLDRKPK
jgi:hypothetical protein